MYANTCFYYETEILVYTWGFCSFFKLRYNLREVGRVGVTCTFWWILTGVYPPCPFSFLSSHFQDQNTSSTPESSLTSFLHLPPTLPGKHCSDFYLYRWLWPVLKCHVNASIQLQRVLCSVFFFLFVNNLGRRRVRESNIWWWKDRKEKPPPSDIDEWFPFQ